MQEFGKNLALWLYTTIGHAYSTKLPVAFGGRPEHWATSHPTTPIVRGSPQVVFPQMTWGRCLFWGIRCPRITR
jgi:hypothetical protein